MITNCSVQEDLSKGEYEGFPHKEEHCLGAHMTCYAGGADMTCCAGTHEQDASQQICMHGCAESKFEAA